MVAANCLIGFVTYMYLTVLAPNYLVPFLGTAGAAAVVCVGLFLLFNILFNYWACVLTRPGWPGHHLQPEELYPSEEQAGVSRFKKTCRRCTTPKPPRCHHCSVCNRCRRTRNVAGYRSSWQRHSSAARPRSTVITAHLEGGSRSRSTTTHRDPPRPTLTYQVRDEDGPPLPVGEQLRRLLTLILALTLPYP